MLIASLISFYLMVVCPGQPSICLNGGTCVEDPDRNDGFDCQCVGDITGRFCESKYMSGSVCLQLMYKFNSQMNFHFIIRYYNTLYCMFDIPLLYVW